MAVSLTAGTSPVDVHWVWVYPWFTHFINAPPHPHIHTPTHTQALFVGHRYSNIALTCIWCGLNRIVCLGWISLSNHCHPSTHPHTLKLLLLHLPVYGVVWIETVYLGWISLSNHCHPSTHPHKPGFFCCTYLYMVWSE